MMRNISMGRREFLKKTAAVSMMAGMVGAMAEAPDPVPGVYKKALQIGMLPATLSDADKFKLAKDCGFCGIEGAPLPDLDAASGWANWPTTPARPFIRSYTAVGMRPFRIRTPKWLKRASPA